MSAPSQQQTILQLLNEILAQLQVVITNQQNFEASLQTILTQLDTLSQNQANLEAAQAKFQTGQDLQTDLLYKILADLGIATIAKLTITPNK